MRLLFLSGLYGSPLQPATSPGNTRILHAMRRYADIDVIAPIPYYPEPFVRNRPQLHALSRLPYREYDDDGSTILHPRTLHIPRVGRALYAGLFGASVLASVVRLHKKRRFDAVLTAWAYPDGTASVAIGKMLGLPTVLRVLGTDINELAQQPYRRPQIAWATRTAQFVIAVSRQLKAEVEKLGTPSDRVLWVPTGVDPARFFETDKTTARATLGVPPGRRLIVIPGRLHPIKGLSVFLRALKDVAGAPHAIFVGDGPERKKLEDEALALGIAERVTFAGFQPELRMGTYYAAADLMCLSSFKEGWPDVIMESFACGCPVVASNVGGIPDMMELTGGGLLSKAGDVDDLRAKIDLALVREWDRRGLAELMKEHTLDATARAYVDILEQARAAVA